ncbi:MAG: DHH family phosphoesterase [Lachnospiraceae bacterium]|nr:DHH family phosphoesterase [Lachnospiraceae bacterium]
MTIRELIGHCKDHKIYIQTHNFPDPDAIGSAYGLQRLFGLFGVESELVYVGRIDRVNTRKMMELCGIQMRSYQETETEMKKEDLIICVDSQKGAGNIQDLKGDEIACIDHHPYVPAEGMIFHDVRMVGSCATIIGSYYEELQCIPDAVTATALLYGLKTDTLNFTRGVQAEDILAFSRLYAACDRDILSQLEHVNMEFEDLKAYGTAIQNIELYGNLGLAMIPFPCPDALIATISDFILALDAVEVAVVYAKRKDGIKFSARSEVTEQVDAGELLKNALEGYGNGGGHAFMAGGLIPAENVGLLGNDIAAKIREMIIAFVNMEK